MSDPNVYPAPTSASDQEPVTIATQSPIPGAEWDDPAINYAARTAEAQAAADAEMIPHPVATSSPLAPMADEDALAMAREIEARYMPPPPPPSIMSQINAMKGGGAENEASQPPPQP